jgi:hypothetical protein
MFFYIGRLGSLRCASIELVFGLQPIIKLIAREAATFEVDFICAEPDFFTSHRMVSGSFI